MPDLDGVADELYGLPPDDFVPERDAAAALARERGDRELARAIAKLRRPTRAAWLANLLVRHRAEQLDGLLGLAAGLADAQRTLDGPALRRLSSRRHQLVAAMAREAGRLAQEAGDPAGDGVLRELQGILEAALAQPEIAERVRSGRLTRTVSYTGFGPAAEAGTEPAPRPAPRPAAEEPGAEPEAAEPGTAEEERDDQALAERERAEREEAERARAERERRERELAAAESAQEQAQQRQDADEGALDAAREARDEARSRVAELTAELDAARERERAAVTAAREADTAAKSSARAAGAAAARTARARARLDEARDERSG